MLNTLDINQALSAVIYFTCGFLASYFITRKIVRQSKERKILFRKKDNQE